MLAIKINCACGQPLSFDVEPVNGRMPAPVRCPGCGADGTAAANQFLANLKSAPPPIIPVTSVPPLRQPALASPAPPPRKKNTVQVIALIAIVVPVMTVASMFSAAATKRYLERSKTPPPTSHYTNAPVRSIPISPGRANIPAPTLAKETPPPADAEKVEILWGGQWFPGHVVKRDGARTLIHYNGWADSWNEWVTAEKLRPGK